MILTSLTKKGFIAYQADEQAREALGLPVMITSDRDFWLANGQVFFEQDK